MKQSAHELKSNWRRAVIIIVVKLLADAATALTTDETTTEKYNNKLTPKIYQDLASSYDIILESKK